MNKKQIMMATALVSTLALSGCASNGEIIEQQKQQAEQINTLDSKVNTLESQLQRQQNSLSQQVEQAAKIYSIKQNDTLSSVARENGMSLEALLQLNPQIEKPNSLLIGQMINVK